VRSIARVPRTIHVFSSSIEIYGVQRVWHTLSLSFFESNPIPGSFRHVLCSLPTVSLAPLKFFSSSESRVPIAVHSVLSSPRERSCAIPDLRSTISDFRFTFYTVPDFRRYRYIELCLVRSTPKSRRVVGCVCARI